MEEPGVPWLLFTLDTKSRTWLRFGNGVDYIKGRWYQSPANRTRFRAGPNTLISIDRMLWILDQTTVCAAKTKSNFCRTKIWNIRAGEKGRKKDGHRCMLNTIRVSNSWTSSQVQDSLFSVYYRVDICIIFFLCVRIFLTKIHLEYNKVKQINKVVQVSLVWFNLTANITQYALSNHYKENSLYEGIWL